MTADQVFDSQDLADLLSLVLTSKSRREQLSQTVLRRTIFTKLTKIVESPVLVQSPVIESAIEICDPKDIANHIYQHELPINGNSYYLHVQHVVEKQDAAKGTVIATKVPLTSLIFYSHG
ncbi:hypothetical protein LIER_30825 [Lithospermum erythrorhizon]|uniref:Uncharacterized protein n=1 Tax=Lithospermum erythrorhizon TaxID=34254 RepID=A0AAV3RSC4_LITER